MRLVFVNSARDWGGAESWSSYLCRGMAERGHEVIFVCHPAGELHRRLADHPDVRRVPIRIRGEVAPIRLAQLTRLFRRVRPDVVVTYRTRDTKLGVVAQWLAGGLPLVQAHKSPAPLRDALHYRLLWTRGVRAMAVSSFRNERVLLEHASWLSGIPIRVIYNGVDLERFRPRPEERKQVRRELGLPDAAFVVSYHGRIEERKQVDVMVDAVAEAARRREVRGLFMGSGPQLDGLRQRVEAAGEPIAFLGFRKDVPRLLAAADAALHLSVSDTLPHSVLEALASGLPTVVSDEPSHLEQVDHLVHGLVVPREDATAAAEAIVRLVDEPDLRGRMAEAARERSVSMFDRDRMVDEYQAFLEEVIRGAPLEPRDRAPE